MEHECEWPEVFTNPEFAYPETGRQRWGKTFLRALTDGHIGWANCMAGASPPPLFGLGMVRIDDVLGCPALPDNLDKLSKAWKKAGKPVVEMTA